MSWPSAATTVAAVSAYRTVPSLILQVPATTKMEATALTKPPQARSAAFTTAARGSLPCWSLLLFVANVATVVLLLLRTLCRGLARRPTLRTARLPAGRPLFKVRVRLGEKYYRDFLRAVAPVSTTERIWHICACPICVPARNKCRNVPRPSDYNTPKTIGELNHIIAYANIMSLLAEILLSVCLNWPFGHTVAARSSNDRWSFWPVRKPLFCRLAPTVAYLRFECRKFCTLQPPRHYVPRPTLGTELLEGVGMLTGGALFSV